MINYLTQLLSWSIIVHFLKKTTGILCSSRKFSNFSSQTLYEAFIRPVFATAPETYSFFWVPYYKLHWINIHFNENLTMCVQSGVLKFSWVSVSQDMLAVFPTLLGVFAEDVLQKKKKKL